MFSIRESIYPELYKVADRASIKLQKKLFLYQRIYLIMLILVTFVTYYFPESQFGSTVSALLFMANIFLLVAIKVEKLDSKWYNARTVAESVKTISWKWMMRAKPYQNKDNVNQIFYDLRQIFDQNLIFSYLINSMQIPPEMQISTEMKEIRKMSFDKRKKFYLKERLKNQLSWYSQKSRENRRKGEIWFWFSILLHTLAIILLCLKIMDYQYQFPIEVIAITACAVFTWLQAKRFSEVSSTYAQTAHEITIIGSESDSVSNDDSFAKYVANSENAFSREYTQWYAKKVVY